MNLESNVNTSTGGLSSWSRRVFGVDLRSLAVFRIFLGLVILLDVWMRWPDAEAFYSDNGVFSRLTSFEFFDRFHGSGWEDVTWSLNWISGSVGWQQILFGVEALCAMALLLGFATRLSTVVCWLLIVSQHIRNPLVITSGDTLLKVMLFWSVFLPLGRIWSIDRSLNWTRRAKPDLWYVSPASAGLIMQVILMYFFTGVAKFNDVWFEGHAMDYVLRLDLYIRPFGKWMLGFPWLLKLVAWGTLLIELIGIWFLLLPGRNSLWRVLNLLAYWGFHFGIALCMTIGLFPLICMIAWLPLLPREIWTSTPIDEAHTERGLNYRPAIAIGIVLIGISLWWNLSNLRHSVLSNTLPRPLEYVGRVLGMEQHFQMFGIPPHESPWFVYEARLVNGDKVDIFRPDAQFSLARPDNISGTFPGHNWRKLHQNLVDRRLIPYRAYLLDYAVRKWNAAHDRETQVRAATLRCFVEITGPNYNPINRLNETWGTYEDPRLGPGSKLQDLEDQLEKNGVPF